MNHSSHLVRMVCDIASFFATQKDRSAAVNGIVNHLEMFWDPRMRRKLIISLPEARSEMPSIACEAIEKLASRTAKPDNHS